MMQDLSALMETEICNMRSSISHHTKRSSTPHMKIQNTICFAKNVLLTYLAVESAYIQAIPNSKEPFCFSFSVLYSY